MKEIVEEYGGAAVTVLFSVSVVAVFVQLLNYVTHF